jgi:hypothetical protein
VPGGSEAAGTGAGVGVSIGGSAVAVGSGAAVSVGGIWVGAGVGGTVGAGSVSAGRGATVVNCATGNGDGVVPQAASKAASRSSRIVVRKVLIGASPRIGRDVPAASSSWRRGGKAAPCLE